MSSENGRWKVDPRLAVSIVGWIVTIVLAWGFLGTRMSVNEQRDQEQDRRLGDYDHRLERMEGKLDLLLQRP